MHGFQVIGAAGLLGLVALAMPEAHAGPVEGTGARDDASAVVGAMPAAVAVAPLPLGAYRLDDPTPPPPPAPSPSPGVTVYGDRAATAPPTVTFAPQVPYGGGVSPTGLAQDTRLGPYRQPEWTTDRRWARVRSYVLPPWQLEFESWYRGRFRKKGQGDRHLFQEEIGIGLPHRFMLDFYLNFEDTPDRDLHFKETQVELRYALADWDCLPLNPTLYLEYKLHDALDEPDVIEGKLLLSDDLACRWQYGVNLTYERELAGEEEEVLGATAALSYTVIDQRFSVGVEAQYERATVKADRDEVEETFYLGPSFQIRFDNRTHLDIAPLFGLTEPSNVMQLFIVFGIDIGPGGGEGGWLNPVAARGR